MSRKTTSSRKKILLIYTGGTIGMMKDHHTGALRPVDFSAIVEQVPELRQLNCSFGFHAFGLPIDSSNVQPEFWGTLARVIEREYARYDGFVILHGTDTMAYTASALSYMLQNLDKPVLLTGSQLPLGAIRTDARRNLITSVEIIAGDVLVPEVCICFSNQLYRGNRAEKYTSSKFDAFHSLNYPVLAEAGTHIVFDKPEIRKKPTGKFRVKYGFNTEVALLKIYPGIHTEAMRAILSTPGLRAAIIETYGSGNAPTDPGFLRVLKEAIDRGITLINISQCSGGSVEQGKYETSLHLQEIGVVSGMDMTTEAAITKAMFLLGQGYKGDRFEQAMVKSLAGEVGGF